MREPSAALRQKFEERLSRPWLRGKLHLLAVPPALVGGIILLVSSGGAGTRLALAVYTLTLVGSFLASALYHHTLSRRWYRMRQLDHAMAFILIGGTYTAYSLILSTGSAAVVLAIVWAGAFAGSALSLLWHEAPNRFTVPLYIAVGWIPGLFVIARAAHRLGWVGSVLSP